MAWLVVMLCLCGLTAQAVQIEPGVSKALAEYRQAHVRNVRYSLSFTIPEDVNEPVSFFENLRFAWTGNEDLQLDFQGDINQLDGTLMVNGKHIDIDLRDEHIIVPNNLLLIGENRILIGGNSGDKALNRHEDYLYTLFVPDHARSVFPCFDQPDLKACFELELTTPEGWVTMSNGTEKPIPTYLFSFVAGKFQVQPAIRDGRELTAFYRETDPDKVAQLPKVFDEVALALEWMEDYTGIAYPFEKYGFVVLPGYQFGGMEHPGCIHFTDHEIFLGPNPTPDELRTRLNLIAHETAHMWFGDLVTMRWFDDVWTKEVFANFLADKISREQFPNVNHDLAFIKTHYPAALATDRTQGTHPIQQPLDNLNKAGLLYGNIIYHKAPIMMHKLEQEKGAEALQMGLRSYLANYAYDNATWDDLIAELDQYARDHSARSFSNVWVKQKGLPTVTFHEMDSAGDCEIRQTDPYGRGLTWKQNIKVGFASGPNDEMAIQNVYMDKRKLSIYAPQSTVPVLNSNGEGYGRFVVDKKAQPILANAWQSMPNEMNRYAAIANLYENCLMDNISLESLMDMLLQFLTHENNELIASTLCSYISTLTPQLDVERRHQIENRLLAIAQSHELQPVQQALYRQLGTTATATEVVERLYDIWSTQQLPILNGRDYTRMAYHLAILRPSEWQSILSAQRKRLKTDDECREFDYVSRACTPDENEQKELFKSLLQVENRRVEPWARSILALLNDPTREDFSIIYLRPGLDALEEIQRTGDIFFPGYWLSSLLSGHKSPEARDVVEGWIADHPNLEPALINKLKENAYWLLEFIP